MLSFFKWMVFFVSFYIACPVYGGGDSDDKSSNKPPAVKIADAALKLGGHRTSEEWMSQGNHRSVGEWMGQSNHRTPLEWLKGVPSQNSKNSKK